MRYVKQKSSTDRLSINTINKRNKTISIVANKSNVTGINLNNNSKDLNRTITTVANNGIGVNLNTSSKDLNKNLTTSPAILSLSGGNNQKVTGYARFPRKLLPTLIETGFVKITGNYVGIRDPIIGGLQTPGTFYREVKYAGTAGAAHAKYTFYWHDLSDEPPSETTTWDGSWEVDIKDGSLLSQGNAYRAPTPNTPKLLNPVIYGLNPSGNYTAPGEGFGQLNVNIFDINNPLFESPTKRIWGMPNGLINEPFPPGTPEDLIMYQIGNKPSSDISSWQGIQLYGQLSLEILQQETPADIANNWETRTRGTSTSLNSLTARSEDYRTSFRGQDRGTQGANMSAFQISTQFKGLNNEPLVIYAKIRELDVDTNTTTEYTKTYDAATNSIGVGTNIIRFAPAEINKNVIYTLLDVYAIQ